MPITQQLKSDCVSNFHLKGHYRERVILRYSACILCNFDKVHQLFQMFSKKLLGCDVVRRGMATAPNWAEAVEALNYSKHQTKQNMLDRSRVSQTILR